MVLSVSQMTTTKLQRLITRFIICLWLLCMGCTQLTPSMPAVPNCCCSKGSAPNPPFLIFDIWVLWCSVLIGSERVKWHQCSYTTRRTTNEYAFPANIPSGYFQQLPKHFIILTFNNMAVLPSLIQESSHWASFTLDCGCSLKNFPHTLLAVTDARPSMISLAVVPTSTQTDVSENIQLHQ